MREPTGEWDIDLLDLPAYLRRIGHDGAGAPDAPTLQALHRAHTAAIPFENLDIVLGRGIAVDLESVQAKLVGRRRGGYCYEHGLLFAAALERLGYEVDRFLARVGPDVGFGSGLLAPLPFGTEEPQRQGGWAFALHAAGHEWEMRERRDGEWTTRYRFDDVRQHPADVVVSNHFTAPYPRSPFVGRPIAVRRDEHALHELVGQTLTTTRPDWSSEAREIGDAELAGTLRDVFGLELPEAEVESLARAGAPAA